MPFSMTWKPEDDVPPQPALPGPSKAAGPVPGVLPPSRYRPAPPSKNSSKEAPSTVYNFNWRPDDDVAVPSSLSISPQNSRAHGHASKRFRVTLDSPYEVQSFSKDAFNCTISDVFCAIERSVEHPGMATESSWILQFHPSRAQLSPNAVLDLAKCLFSSIYVAMSVNELGYITLKYENAATLSSSSKAALNVLAIPLEALEQGVSLSASHIMQLFPLASPRLVAPAFPYLPTMTLVGHKPVAHPYRPPSLGRPSVLYSRYIHALGRHVRIESLSSTASSVDLVIDASATSAATRAGASDQGLQATIAWTLESGTPFARDIDDYDRTITFEGATALASDLLHSYLQALLHFSFLEDSRTRKIWVETNEEKVVTALRDLGFRDSQADQQEEK